MAICQLRALAVLVKGVAALGNRLDDERRISCRRPAHELLALRAAVMVAVLSVAVISHFDQGRDVTLSRFVDVVEVLMTGTRDGGGVDRQSGPRGAIAVRGCMDGEAVRQPAPSGPLA